MVRLEENGKAPMEAELETFLPTKSSGKDGQSYKVQIAPPSDPEHGGVLTEKPYDPFVLRKGPGLTTDCDTLTHLLKASLGTGILSMPLAFSKSGLYFGIPATIFVALLCTHCSYILVKCAHALYHRVQVSELGFADVAEHAFKNGPSWGRKFVRPSRTIIQVSLFITYYGTCSVYSVIIAENIKALVEDCSSTDLTCGTNIRLYILMLMVPIVILSWVPNLKYLAPFSMVANALMAVGLGITLYYIVDGLDVSKQTELLLFPTSIGNFASFFALTVFAMEAIGVVMPLENKMVTPRHFLGLCGVLNKGMSAVTLVYILLGFLGYLKYGEETKSIIILNLEPTDILAKVVKGCIACAVFLTFGLQFFVCLDIAWKGIKDRFPKMKLRANYALRTVLAIVCLLIAVAVPQIGPFISLIGAFCFSILGLIIPVILETVTFWDDGFGRYNWIAVKNIVITLIGVLVLFFGSADAIKEIIAKM